jgi:hypothetical protein
LTAKLLDAMLGVALPTLFRELNRMSGGCGLALSVIAGRDLGFPPELRDSVASGCTRPRAAQALGESGSSLSRLNKLRHTIHNPKSLGAIFTHGYTNTDHIHR